MAPVKSERYGKQSSNDMRKQDGSTSRKTKGIKILTRESERVLQSKLIVEENKHVRYVPTYYTPAPQPAMAVEQRERTESGTLELTSGPAVYSSLARLERADLRCEIFSIFLSRTSFWRWLSSFW